MSYTLILKLLKFFQICAHRVDYILVRLKFEHHIQHLMDSNWTQIYASLQNIQTSIRKLIQSI